MKSETATADSILADRASMNVLITSCGAKVQLVRAFRKAVIPWQGKVVACDITPDNPALFEADYGCLIPPSDAHDFVSTITVLCRKYSIRLVVPTRDGELEVFSHHAEAIRNVGAFILLAPRNSLGICLNKRRFVAFCEENGFPTARTYTKGEIPEHFPVFARPAIGAGGSEVCRIDDKESFFELIGAIEHMVVQDYVEAPEYTIDVLMDLDGRPVQAVARRRLAVRAGEAYKSRVEHIEMLTDSALRLCERLHLVGHNVVQAFFTEQCGPLFIEVNPRFGGASNLSIVAGLDSPMRLLTLLAGRAAEARKPRTISYGLTMLRYGEDRFVDSCALKSMPRVGPNFHD